MGLEARAGDQGDIYAYGLIGQHLRTYKGQGTVGVGYCFWDSWGIAPVWDQMSSSYNATLEARYFFEPFETAIGSGIAVRRDKFQDLEYRLLFTASASYLVALSPSLAFKFETKGQFLWEDKGSLFAGAGLRFLY